MNSQKCSYCGEEYTKEGAVIEEYYSEEIHDILKIKLCPYCLKPIDDCIEDDDIESVDYFEMLDKFDE